VLHQDLKSANVLLVMSGGIRKAGRLGFKFIKELSSEMSKSSPVKHNGGIIYMAPELFSTWAPSFQRYAFLSI
jgi:serine/threonine protein kinase